MQASSYIQASTVEERFHTGKHLQKCLEKCSLDMPCNSYKVHIVHVRTTRKAWNTLVAVTFTHNFLLKNSADASREHVSASAKPLANGKAEMCVRSPFFLRYSAPQFCTTKVLEAQSYYGRYKQVQNKLNLVHCLEHANIKFNVSL